MQIEFTAPPKPRQPRRNYNQFIDAVQNAADWISVPLDQVAGTNVKQKQSSIILAAKVRGCRVQTSVQEGRLYARLLTGAPENHT